MRVRSAHISWPAGCSQLLSDYRRQHTQRRTPARSERSQLLWTLPGQNSKEMLHQTCIYFLFVSIFCWRPYFVDAYILWMPIFCRCQYFVDANILLSPIFCQHLYFVEACILSTPIFCWCQYFVDAFILLTLIFCWCQDFSQGLYLLNLLLIIALCLHNDY